MSDFVEKMAAEDMLDASAVERIGRSVSQFLKEAQQNPELMEEAKEKLAFLGMDFSHINPRQFAADLALSGGIAMGVTAAGKAYDAIGGAISKAKNYKQMLAENPDLAERDSKQVQRAFNTLHTFNPSYAADPLVSGAFVRNVVETARFPMEGIHALVQANKNMQERAGLNVRDVFPTSLITKSPMEKTLHPSEIDLNAAKQTREYSESERAQQEAEAARARVRYYGGLNRP